MVDSYVDPETGRVLWTRRMFLIAKMMEEGWGVFEAFEAVSTTAFEHPEWVMTEMKTFEEWEKEHGV